VVEGHGAVRIRAVYTVSRFNEFYLNLNQSYCFAEIRRRTKVFTDAHPGVRLVDLGVGDVTQPLPAAVVRAIHEAADDMARRESFKGYGPYVGYEFLRAEIASHDFGSRGVQIAGAEICATYAAGAGVTRAARRRWGDYARAEAPAILYDAAYEAYVVDPGVPHSIYEIAGAREVAIECRSFSKNAGFTGMRLAYTVVPKEMRGRGADGQSTSLNALWARRTAIKSNGPPYVIQRAAAAVYTSEGQKQVRALIDFYMENARIIGGGLAAAGLTVYGGRNAPYIWVRTPPSVSSWDFFDRVLGEAHVVGAPGAGFGPSGEGYFRLTAFGSRPQTEEAVERIKARL